MKLSPQKAFVLDDAEIESLKVVLGDMRKNRAGDQRKTQGSPCLALTVSQPSGAGRQQFQKVSVVECSAIPNSALFFAPRPEWPPECGWAPLRSN